MFKFDEAKFLANEKKAIEFIPKVEKIVDEVCEKGYSNIFFVGIGGTITYEWQVESIIKSMSTLDLYVENAAEFLTVGNKKFTKDSIVVIQSASGDTKEVVQAVDYAHEVGAKVIGLSLIHISMLYDVESRKFYQQGIYPVENIVDTMGAGDSFIARYFVGIYDGEAIGESMENAAEFAAKNCLVSGTFGYETDIK